MVAGAEKGQRLLPILSQFHRVAVDGECHAHRLRHQWLIFGDQDSLRRDQLSQRGRFHKLVTPFIMLGSAVQRTSKNRPVTGQKMVNICQNRATGTAPNLLFTKKTTAQALANLVALLKDKLYYKDDERRETHQNLHGADRLDGTDGSQCSYAGQDPGRRGWNRKPIATQRSRGDPASPVKPCWRQEPGISPTPSATQSTGPSGERPAPGAALGSQRWSSTAPSMGRICRTSTWRTKNKD